MLFEYDGRQIVVSKGIESSDLTIDGKIYDMKTGFDKIQFQSYKLEGTIQKDDGKSDSVVVEVKLGFPSDTVSCYYNGKLIGKEKVSLGKPSLTSTTTESLFPSSF